jgi:cytochrome c-type biogenesis protein CcmH/NrfG
VSPNYLINPNRQFPTRNVTIEVKDESASLMDELARLAAAEIEQADFTTAEKILRRGLEHDPNHPRCRAYMAICGAALDRCFSQAEELARSVTRDYPNEPGGWFALGHVHLLAGKRAVAFQHFAHARELVGRDRGLRAWLARQDPRRPPVIRTLSRDNVLNRICGRLRAWFRPHG